MFPGAEKKLRQHLHTQQYGQEGRQTFTWENENAHGTSKESIFS